MNDTQKKKEKIFFPNLDGLRFICFLLVFLYHWNLNCAGRIENDAVRDCFNFLFKTGNIGVNIFFVLSGFLITYLLISEKKFIKDISLKNFYIRRILRIWPLYYLMIFFGFVILAFFKYKSLLYTLEPSSVLFYIIFLANFDLIRIWPQLPDALPIIVLWSVAVEEQFYLIWPIFLKYVKVKNLPYLFILIILITVFFRSFFTEHTDHDYAIRYFHTLSVIGDMALGGLMAFFCYSKNKIFIIIVAMPKYLIFILYSVTIILILFKQEIFITPLLIIFERIILSILFALIIAEQNFSKHSFFKFSNFRFFSKMGIYTYGLYCMQFIGIIIVQKGFDKLGLNLGNWGLNLLACIIALAIVTILSIISYHYFEKFFLNKKDKFAVILNRS